MSHKLSWGCRRIHSGAAYGHVAVRFNFVGSLLHADAHPFGQRAIRNRLGGGCWTARLIVTNGAFGDANGGININSVPGPIGGAGLQVFSQR